MASGHANRANRPNTWLHRPATQREVLTCQPGAVHTWHKADVQSALRWSNVDLSTGTVTVVQSLEQTKEGLRFKSAEDAPQPKVYRAACDDR